MRFLSILVVLVFCACSTQKTSVKDETQQFNEFLNKTFDEFLSFSPQSLSYLGKKKFNDKLDDYTEAFQLKILEYQKTKLEELKGFKISLLDEQAKLSYQLFKEELEESIEDYQWRDYFYPVTHMSNHGVHADLPVFMMTIHQVDNESDLRAYLSRLAEFQRVFREVLDNVARSERQGVIPPKFVFPYVLDASQKVIQGKPFDNLANDSPLLADFKEKLKKLNLEETKRTYFLKKVEQILLSSVKPAYAQFIKSMKEQAQRSTKDDGVWKFKHGDKFYNSRLKRETTTSMTSEQIHNLGLKHVARLHEEMREVLKKLNYKKSLQDFFKELRSNAKYYYPNTEEGRAAYLTASRQYYAEINKKIPAFFRLRPKAAFEIRAVEKFREDSTYGAFYNPPAEDGSRAGVYYVNLKNMRDLPKHEAEVVLYHEGAPGHHFQVALAQEMKGLPHFRRYMEATAFAEGWGLYTERLAKEMGAYKDPLSEFGRLSLELMRATRLVVDTGLHAKKWTREQALKYLSENMPNSLDDQKNEVERYIVMPGQATAYMIGMLKIVELRERAQQQLKQKFDIRDFHDVVLGNGAVPLNVLEDLVNRYIKNKNKEK